MIEKPIYFLSHRLSDTQTRWSTIEKEAYAIYYSLQKLDHYLQNFEFVIKTDHKPLKYILDSPMQNKKIQLWALSMHVAGYNCRIEYIAGTDNSVADLLSRVPIEAESLDDATLENPDISEKTYEINALNSNRFSPKQYARCTVEPNDSVEKPTLDPDIEIAVEQDKDESIIELKIGLINDKLSKAIAKKHLLTDNVLYYISNADSDPILRLYIPAHTPHYIMTLNGHMGVDKNV